MTTMVITRGVPASGKSTWAKEWVAESPTTRVRVNRDNLRWTLGIKTGVGTYEQESEVTHWQNAMIERALKAGKDVVVDNTNLRAKNVKELLKLAAPHGALVQFMDFEVSEGQAIWRDAERQRRGERYVGEDVIKMMFDKFMTKGKFPEFPELDSTPVPKFPLYVPNESLPAAFGFDLDGTLARFKDPDTRSPYDTSLYHTDRVDVALRTILRTLYLDGHKIIIITGRSEKYRSAVEQWLVSNGIFFSQLVMRKEGDTRNDAIVKSELFDEFIAPDYNFLAQFDDRDRVVEALRSKGIPVYQVAPGAF